MRALSVLTCLAAIAGLAGCGGRTATDAQPGDGGMAGAPGAHPPFVQPGTGTGRGPGGGAPPGEPSSGLCNASMPFVVEDLHLAGEVPSVTRDETTLVYVLEGVAYERKRPSVNAAFGPATAFIAKENLDVVISPDGLDLDFVVLTNKGTALHSARATSSSPFGAGTPPVTPDPALPAWRFETVGTSTYYTHAWDESLHVKTGGGVDSIVVASAMRWFAVSSNDLVLHYASLEGMFTASYVARRASTAVPFGAGTKLTELTEPAPGFEQLFVTWVSDDDCVAYGWAAHANSTTRTVGIFRAQRGK